MKKILLMGGAMLVATAAGAVTPQEFSNAYFVGVSPDGTTAVSEITGTISIYDVESGQMIESYEGSEGAEGYGIGAGNFISSNDIIVGFKGENAAYLKDGEWNLLSTPNPEIFSQANAITPDGLRIVGSVGLAPMSTDDTEVPMQVPAVWDLKEDGTYGDCVVLPYPEKDFTRRVPQYVMAVNISSDGKLVAGQVRDYSGGVHTLIYWTLDDDGKWVMHNEFDILANPNKVEIPDYPGEGPMAPDKKNFMSEDELKAYNDAVAAWNEAGTWDYSTYPNEDDYLTDEEKAAYNEAYAEYEKANDEWLEKLNVFFDALEKCGTINLVLNSVLLSEDARTVVCNQEISGEMEPGGWGPAPSTYTPIVFNLDNTTYESYPDKNVVVSFLGTDGTMMGFRESMTDPRQVMVYLPGEKEPVRLSEYFKTRDEEVYDFMQEYMVHDFESFDPETYDPVIVEDYEFSGTAKATPDMKVIVCATQNVWDYMSDIYFYSYVLPNGPVNGICNPGMATVDTEELPVYNMHGMRVGAGRKALGELPAGIYMIGSRKVVVK